MRIKATYTPLKFIPSTKTEDAHFIPDTENAVSCAIVQINHMASLRGEAIAIPSNGSRFIEDSLDCFSDIEWPAK